MVYSLHKTLSPLGLTLTIVTHDYDCLMIPDKYQTDRRLSRILFVGTLSSLSTVLWQKQKLDKKFDTVCCRKKKVIN